MSSPFGSPSERRTQARIDQQARLASTIKKIEVVDNVDVHLNIPDKGPFERKVAKPSASVLLTLGTGKELSDQQAASIASLVAYAVEGLEPGAVQITDKDGFSYNIPDDYTRKINDQVEYAAYAERKLAEKAQTQLQTFLGYGNASVQVSLDLTFSEGSRHTTKYEADGKVATEEDLVTETKTSTGQTAQGAAGIASNTQTPAGGTGKSDVLSKTENIKSTYVIPVTEETQENSTPIRNYMTVSVLVNSEANNVADQDGAVVSGLDNKVTDIVKNAVGFKEDTDTISVEFLPFPEGQEVTETVPSSFTWSNINQIVENAALVLAAGFAFLLGLLLLRRIRPIRETAGAQGAKLEGVNELSQLVEKNPEIFSTLVQVWSDGGEKEQSAKSLAKKAA